MIAGECRRLMTDYRLLGYPMAAISMVRDFACKSANTGHTLGSSGDVRCNDGSYASSKEVKGGATERSGKARQFGLTIQT